MKKIFTVFILTIILSANFQLNQAVAQRPMHELHAMLIFNFIKYVEWPEASKSGDFIIAVYGDSGVFDELNKLYGGGKSIKGQTVKMVNASSVADLKKAHLIYLADNKSGDFQEILSGNNGSPTLLVTDKNGLGEKGSNINFKTVGGKLKFEINQSAFDKNNLKVSSSLLSMAIVI